MQNSMEYFWAKTEVECCHFPWREGTDLRPAANPPVPDLGAVATTHHSGMSGNVLHWSTTRKPRIIILSPSPYIVDTNTCTGRILMFWVTVAK